MADHPFNLEAFLEDCSGSFHIGATLHLIGGGVQTGLGDVKIFEFFVQRYGENEEARQIQVFWLPGKGAGAIYARISFQVEEVMPSLRLDMLEKVAARNDIARISSAALHEDKEDGWFIVVRVAMRLSENQVLAERIRQFQLVVADLIEETLEDWSAFHEEMVSESSH